MPKFDELITRAVSRRASDLHLTAALPPMIRVDGALLPMGADRLTPEEIDSVVRGVMTPAQLSALETHGDVDFAYSIPGTGRFRLNVFRQRGTLALAARVLNPTVPTPEELGLPQALVDVCAKRRGLVLVTGPTGSGKSTTLAALIHTVNQTRSCHVITMEDPIEYLHRHQCSIVNQRELGSDFQSYASALRAALREDPDVLLVGEMRDLETISTAITAAETGHLVFSTLHTVGAANTIDRIIDVFPPYQQQQVRTQLADVLECVASQQLLPKNGGGRVAAIELMLSNNAIRAYIREGKTFQIASVLQTNRRAGMLTMDDALLSLCLRGDITEETALAAAQDPSHLRQSLI